MILPARFRNARETIYRAIPRQAVSEAVRAAPLAVWTSLGIQVVAGTAALIWARPQARAGIVLLMATAVVTFLVALGARSMRPVLVSVLCTSAALALSDMPVGRAGAGVYAALAGCLVLCLAELETNSLEPSARGPSRHNPVFGRFAWVALVATAGAAGGWAILSVRHDIGGLGLTALGIGVAAAVAVIVLAGAMARLALEDVREARTSGREGADDLE